MRLSLDKQREVLSKLNEGDVFEAGDFLQLDPDERLVWRCEEIVPQGDMLRFTFHVFYMEVMLKSVIAEVSPEFASIKWRS